MKDFSGAGTYISPEIRSYTSEEILEMIGPAETQYGPQYTVTLQLLGAQGALPCGSTITDGDANDMDTTNPGSIGWSTTWNDLPTETGYRFQADWTSPTFVNEDSGIERPANTTSYGFTSSGSGTWTNTLRVRAHFGGCTGICGNDVISNDCTITLVWP